MAERLERIYALEIDGRPVLTYPAISQKEARELAREAWLLDDLSGLKSKWQSRLD